MEAMGRTGLASFSATTPYAAPLKRVTDSWDSMA